MIEKISIKEILEYFDVETVDFPKYAAPLINLANQYAQGTRPKVVGQMTELIKEFRGKSLSEWEKWYSGKNPEAIRNATEKILHKLKELKNSLNEIDQPMVERWVRDLVIVKTFAGLRFQEAVLKKGAYLKGSAYRLAEPVEESKGIDGYIGDTPVSIKPSTYEGKAGLPEQISVKIIYYKKVRNSIEVDYGELFR